MNNNYMYYKITRRYKSDDMNEDKQIKLFDQLNKKANAKENTISRRIARKIKYSL